MSVTLVGALEICSDVLDPWVEAPADRSLSGDIPGALGAMVTVEHQLEVIRLRLLAAFDAEDLGPGLGVANAGTFWALIAAEDRSTAGRDRAFARRLFRGDLTDTGEAMAAGRISIAQARAVHRGTSRLLEDDVTALQRILLASPALAPEHIGLLAAKALEIIETRSSQEQRHERAEAAKSFTMARVGEGLHVEGFLLGPAADVLEAQITDAAKPVKGPDGQPEQRTRAQRQHDALADLILTAATAPEDLPAASPALATVVLTTEDLAAFTGPFTDVTPQQRAKGEACCAASRTWVAVHHHPDHPDHPEPDAGTGAQTTLTEAAPPPPQPPPAPQPPTLPWLRAHPPSPHPPRTNSDPFTAAVIRHALTHLAPAFGGIPTDVLDLGRTERDFTRAQRRALGHRDGGCVGPGCHAPPRRCARAPPALVGARPRPHRPLQQRPALHLPPPPHPRPGLAAHPPPRRHLDLHPAGHRAARRSRLTGMQRSPREAPAPPDHRP